MLNSPLKFRLLRSLFFIGFIMQAVTAQSYYYSTAQGAYHVDGINYWISGNSAYVTYYGKSYERYYLDQGGYVDWFDGYISGNSGNVPSTVVINSNTYSVTSIGEHAYENSGVQSVILPNTITSIGTQAFYDCELTDIVLPQSISSIGESAFSGCSKLTSVIIPQKITTLNSRVFSGCSSLSSIVIPDNVTSMGTSVFSGCSGLTSVTISNSLSSIGDNVFYGCKGLTSLDIPTSVKTIGNTSFAYCSSLESISIPNSVVSIGNGAFSGCNGLTSLIIPYSVTSIGTSAFQGCSGLASIVVDSNNPKYDSRLNCNAIIETSGNTLLMGCQNTIIPDNVTIIGSNAFYGCYGLTSINFPSSVKTIGDHSFEYCRGLTNVYIPNSITLIGSYAFSGCSNLSIVEIHTTRIGDEFSGNSSIENLILGNEVETIADQAFQNCSGITSLCIPDRVTSIGSNAFRGCNGLTTIYLSSSLKSIGSYAFYGCDSLTSVYMNCFQPLSIGSTTFSNQSNATLYVPMGTKEAYEAANYWKDFKEIIEVGGMVTPLDLSACPGGLGSTMNIEMRNTEDIIGFQFDLQLPEGVSLTIGANGKYIANLTNRKVDHTLSVNKVGENTYRFISVSMNNEPFEGKEGTLLNITVKVDDTVAFGNYDIKVLNAELTTSNMKLVNSMDETSILTVKNADPGDANGDMTVSVTDVGCAINYILEQTPSIFFFDAADMNGDKSVSVTDVAMIINLILNEGAASRSFFASRSSDEMLSPNVSLLPTNIGYQMRLENKERFIGFQFDIELEEGATINNMQLADADEGDHLLTYLRLNNGKWRVVCYSPTNSNFAASESVLLNIQTTGGFTIDNIRLTTSGLDELHPTALTSMPTGIASIDKDFKMKVQEGTLCITSDRDVTLSIFSLDGKVIRNLNVHRGQNNISGLRSGIYMINNQKIIIQ